MQKGSPEHVQTCVCGPTQLHPLSPSHSLWLNYSGGSRSIGAITDKRVSQEHVQLFPNLKWTRNVYFLDSLTITDRDGRSRRLPIIWGFLNATNIHALQFTGNDAVWQWSRPQAT